MTYLTPRAEYVDRRMDQHEAAGVFRDDAYRIAMAEADRIDWSAA